MDATVTYDPTDDKLRVYFATRQPTESLEPLRQAGFRWAGHQECWFAVWTPAREDAALAATGADAIDDEPGNIMDRAADREERFSDYASKAKHEADSRCERAMSMARNLNGQPILVGHHSEKGHRALLRRMDNDMRKSVEADKRAGYWASRATNGVLWARYKDNPGVRARRIKTLEADLRRHQRARDRVNLVLKVFTPERPIEHLIAYCNDGRSMTSYETWNKLRAIHEEPGEDADVRRLEVVANVRRGAESSMIYTARWIEHLEGRIAYEKDQLGEQGGMALLAPKPRRAGKAAIPLRNLPGGHPMAKADYAKIHKDYKGTKVIDHEGNKVRVRTAMVRIEGRMTLATITLTDQVTA